MHGGYIAAARTYDGSLSHVTIVKYDANGVEKWNQLVFDVPGNQDVWCIQQAADGGYLLCGMFWNTVSTGSGLGWLAKTDSRGIVQWVKPSTSPGISVAQSVQHTSDGGYVVTGVSSDASSSLAVAKLDALENVEWNNVYIEAQGSGRSVQQTSEGGFIIVNSLGLVKIDRTGLFEWSQTYSTSDSIVRLYSVQQTPDGGYIAVGSIWSSGQLYGYLVKTDDLGAVQWTKTFSLLGGYFSSVRSTSDGWYIAAGEIRTTTSTPYVDAYLVKFGPLPTNTAPTIDALTVTPTTVAVTKPVEAKVAFTDPDAGDAHTATFKWGDGKPDTVVDVAPGVMSVSSTHSYTDANTYTATCTVKDATDTSPPKTATVKVISQASVAKEASDLMKLPGVSAGDFVTTQAYNAYTNKVNALVTAINGGQYADARAKITDDLLLRTTQWVKDPSKTILIRQLWTIYGDLLVLQAAQG